MVGFSIAHSLDVCSAPVIVLYPGLLFGGHGASRLHSSGPYAMVGTWKEKGIVKAGEYPCLLPLCLSLLPGIGKYQQQLSSS
jgi:hypothetical protein